jgi:hypothetical protein
MEHEDPDREQRDSSFDNDPDAERKMDERFAEMAAHAGRRACRNKGSPGFHSMFLFPWG